MYPTSLIRRCLTDATLIISLLISTSNGSSEDLKIVKVIVVPGSPFIISIASFKVISTTDVPSKCVI